MTLSLFFLLLCSYLFSASANKIQNCFPDFDVITELEDRYGLYFYDHYCTLQYDFDNIIADFFPNKNTDVTITNINVTFAGNVVPPRELLKTTKVNFQTLPITIKHSKGNGKEKCKIISSDNFKLSLNPSDKVTAAIIQYTEVCVQAYVCQNFVDILSDESIHVEIHESEHINRSDIAINEDEKKNATSTQALTCENIYNPQKTINTLIDFGLSAVVSKFINNNSGVFELPCLFINYSTGVGIFKTTGEIEATNGTFVDLRTLKRSKDLILENENLRFIASSTYSLPKAKLQFDQYRARYGIIKISGHLSVEIQSLSIKIKIAIDFNAKPCKVQLMILEVEEFGNVDVDFTGLGILNKPIQNLLEWLIKKKTFETIREVVGNQLSLLDCEQYRPSIELVR